MATQAWTGSLLGRSHWALSPTRTPCTTQVRCRCLGTRGARGPLTTQVRGLQCSVTAMPSPRGAEAVLPEFLPHRTTMEGSALPRSNPIEGSVLEINLVTAFIVSCIPICLLLLKLNCITEYVLLVNLQINCCDNCNRIANISRTYLNIGLVYEYEKDWGCRWLESRP